MAETRNPRRRCACGHALLRQRRTEVLVCPACDLLGEWPPARKGSWIPV